MKTKDEIYRFCFIAQMRLLNDFRKAEGLNVYSLDQTMVDGKFYCFADPETESSWTAYQTVVNYLLDRAKERASNNAYTHIGS